MRRGSAEASFEGGSFSMWLLALRSRVASERVEITVARPKSLSFWKVRLDSWLDVDELDIVVVLYCGMVAWWSR